MSAYCFSTSGVVLVWLFSLHSQELMTRSYFLSSSRLLHRAVAAAGVPGAAPPLPLKNTTDSGPAELEPNSDRSIPSFEKMHASPSQPPVTTAILGISPSLRFFGRRNVPSGSGVSAHSVTTGT